jgi:acetyl-CoA decarbonylase/synthase complex subunit beta
VNVFFCHTKCQGFAPNHVCIITPERPGCCGCTYEICEEKFRKGEDERLFEFKKGKCLDASKGEYSGVNEIVREKSNGKHLRYFLHSMFGYPHTNCGCFSLVAFHIKDLDKIGIVHKDFDGEIFGTSAGELMNKAKGGEQVEGYLGTCIEYVKSPKFLQGDGGWERIAWMANEIKGQALDSIPENLREKIATEKDARTVDELKKFLGR